MGRRKGPKGGGEEGGKQRREAKSLTSLYVVLWYVGVPSDGSVVADGVGAAVEVEVVVASEGMFIVEDSR